jgi:hypothetical protein
MEIVSSRVPSDACLFAVHTTRRATICDLARTSSE